MVEDDVHELPEHVVCRQVELVRSASICARHVERKVDSFATGAIVT
jgi:hypothetical protein